MQRQAALRTVAQPYILPYILIYISHPAYPSTYSHLCHPTYTQNATASSVESDGTIIHPSLHNQTYSTLHIHLHFHMCTSLHTYRMTANSVANWSRTVAQSYISLCTLIYIPPYISIYAFACLPTCICTGRNGKQCRERWHNHLKPDINKDDWTAQVRGAHKHTLSFTHTHTHIHSHTMMHCNILHCNTLQCNALQYNTLKLKKSCSPHH